MEISKELTAVIKELLASTDDKVVDEQLVLEALRIETMHLYDEDSQTSLGKLKQLVEARVKESFDGA